MSVPSHLEPVVPDRMELRIRMDATVTVYDHAGQATDWLKPGSEAMVSWPGIPSEAEVILRFNALTTVTSATLESMLIEVRKRVDAIRRGG